MAFTKITDDLNIIQNLPNQPTPNGGYTPTTAKAKFDEAGNTIKTYINDTLIPELETSVDPTLRSDYTAFTETINGSLSEINNNFSDKLAKYIKLMQNNGTVIIDCKGDSTYYGQTTGGVQTTEPVNVVLQKILRGYFNNNNITVNNVGVSGYATSDVIDTWDSYLSVTSANIIYINYCLNDPYKGVTPEQYRANLKTMILKARASGKEVVLDMPNQNINVPAKNSVANQTNTENTKYFANIMYSVAFELEVPFIDNLSSVDVQWEYFKDPTTVLTDGVHPVQTFYNFKSVQMARALIFNERAKNTDYIPCYSNLFKYYGSTSSGIVFNGGKYVWAANQIRIAFWVEKTSDLTAYLVYHPTLTGVATAINATLDNVSILSNYSLVMSNTVAKGGYKEFLLGKNLKKGLHYLTIDGVSNPAFLHYLRLLPASSDNEVISVKLGDAGKKLANGTRYFVRNHLPIPVINNNTVIEFDAFLCDGFGLEIVGEVSTSTDPGSLSILGAVLVTGETRSGVFNIGLLQTTDNIYYTTAGKKVLVAENSLVNTWQNLKLFFDITNGLLKLYLNNSQIASLTLLDNKLVGGFISLLRASSDTTTDSTIYVKNIQYRYGDNVTV